jgi:enoyl-CoA hydratase/carnithine racemase
MVRQLGEAMRAAAAGADIVTLSGEGADFTVGRDRSEPATRPAYDTFRELAAVNEAIASFPGILLSAIRGRAFGLGVSLAMRSDIAIAASDARFCLDEVAHGIPPMFVMQEMVAHLPPKRALEVVLSGREFGADEALQIGMLSRVVPPTALEAAVAELVAAVGGRDRGVVLACKRYLRAVGELPPRARSAFALVEQTEFVMRKR